MSLLTVIVPCFNEQESLPYFYDAIMKEVKVLENAYFLSLEILFVNDGSRDGTLALLREFSKRDVRCRYLSFSRNFGKESAIYAGMQHCCGDYIVFMDADLQHPPAMLEQMYESLLSGEYDIAAARRVDRKGEPPIRSFFARIFYRMINKISKANFVDGASDYRMLTRQAMEAILSMGEYNRFSKGIFGWIGFRTNWIPYENVERVAGETKWSFWGLLLYSIEGIVAFSTTPLAIASIMGILFCLVAFIWMISIIIKTAVYGDPVAGFPTLACLLLLIGGSLQLSLGIIGQYLARTYLETKNRPIYILRETSETLQNSDNQDSADPVCRGTSL